MVEAFEKGVAKQLAYVREVDAKRKELLLEVRCDLEVIAVEYDMSYEDDGWGIAQLAKKVGDHRLMLIVYTKGAPHPGWQISNVGDDTIYTDKNEMLEALGVWYQKKLSSFTAPISSTEPR